MRRRYRYDVDKETGRVTEIEVSSDSSPAARIEIMGDGHYDGLQSPVDGSDISTRRRHREHMKIHNLAVSSDLKETRAKARAERDAFLSGTSTKQDSGISKAVEQAFEKLARKRG